MPEVKTEPSAEAMKITAQLNQLAQPSGQDRATLIILDTTRKWKSSSQENFPCFSVGCIALDAEVDASRGGLVVPCLVAPLEFRTFKNSQGFRVADVSIPDPAEITLTQEDTPTWRGWEVGAQAVGDFVWGQLGPNNFNPTNKKALQEQFIPNVEALVYEAKQSYELV